MSARHVARLKATAIPEAVSDDSEDNVPIVEAPKKSKFAMLAALESSDDSDAEETATTEAVDALEPSAGETAPVVPRNAPSAASKSKKRYSKNKKKGGKKDSATVSTASSADDIAKSMEVLMALEASSAATSKQMDVLLVDVRFLNSDSEWRRLFGTAGDADEGGDVAAIAKAARGHGRKTGAAALKKKQSLHLCKVKGAWPPPPPKAAGGLSMKMTSSVGPVREFEYEWSEGYTLYQELFQQGVLSGDPQSLVDLWRNQPCHIDTMLQLAEYFRTVGQKDTCADFVQRCLYVLETAWHVAFKPWELQCRLNYDCIPNRAFYLTLFRHMQLIGRAGCYRTATEIGRLLLHLAPSRDPMRVLLAVDFYAIRSRQFDLVVKLTECPVLPLPAVLLPGFAYSIPLALYNQCGSHVEAIAAGSTATIALVRALLLFPQCLQPILEGSGISMDTVGVGTAYASVSGLASSQCVWSVVLSHPHFVEPGPESDDLARLVSVFALRHPSLWKQNNLIVWLYSCCRLVMRACDSMSVAADGSTSEPLPAELVAGLGCVEQVAVKGVVDRLQSFRAELFDDTVPASAGSRMPKVLSSASSTDVLPDVVSLQAALRHYTSVMVDEFSEELTTMAPELAAGVGADAERDEMVGAGAGGGGLPGLQNMDAQHGNPLMLLLQSLLPWNVVVPQAGPGEFQQGDFVVDSDSD